MSAERGGSQLRAASWRRSRPRSVLAPPLAPAPHADAAPGLHAHHESKGEARSRGAGGLPEDRVGVVVGVGRLGPAAPPREERDDRVLLVDDAPGKEGAREPLERPAEGQPVVVACGDVVLQPAAVPPPLGKPGGSVLKDRVPKSVRLGSEDICKALGHVERAANQSPPGPVHLECRVHGVALRFKCRTERRRREKTPRGVARDADVVDLGVGPRRGERRGPARRVPHPLLGSRHLGKVERQESLTSSGLQ